MRVTLQRALAPLASVEFQRKYIVGATKDEYVLPEDILETIASCLHRLLELNYGQNEFSAQEIGLIGEFRAMLNSLDIGSALKDASISNRELVEHNRAWIALREKAGSCLAAMGFGISEWERAEGL
jgi:hypothetical protein